MCAPFLSHCDRILCRNAFGVIDILQVVASGDRLGGFRHAVQRLTSVQLVSFILLYFYVAQARASFTHHIVSPLAKGFIAWLFFVAANTFSCLVLCRTCKNHTWYLAHRTMLMLPCLLTRVVVSAEAYGTIASR